MHRLRTPALAALALLVPAGALADTDPDRRPAGAACVPQDNTRLVLANDVAAVYLSGGDSLLGCSTDGTDFVILAGSQFYAPPVMALSRTTAAVARIDDERGLVIGVTELRTGGRFYDVVRPDEQLGSLKVRSDGTMAWVSCPYAPRYGDELVASPRPNCLRAGRSRNRVYLFTPRGERLRRVDAGRRIAPRSLRLSDDTISWTRDGRRKRMHYR